MFDHSFLTKWWLIFCCTVASAFVLQYFDLYRGLWHADITKLSFLVIIVYFLVSLFVGFLTSVTIKNPGHPSLSFLPSCWFAAETFTTLGMLGTVIGFMIVFGPAFLGIDISNIAVTKAAIVQMAGGISTALATTLVGIVCSVLLKLQLVNLETQLECSKETSTRIT